MKIYKYLNLELGGNFLKLPILRISKNDSLNDPFEFLLTKKNSAEIELLFKSQYKNHILEYVNKFWTYGIISLTTTNDNLLMWSHYANEHKGMVIGFEINENNTSDFFVANDSYIFDKVKYKNNRYFKDKINKNNLDKVRLHYLLNKSNNWLYENEYRFIIDYRQSDLIFLDTQNSLFNQTIKQLKINPDDLPQTGKYKIITLAEHNIKEDVLLAVWVLSGHSGAMFFKFVNPNSIKEVFIGSRVDSMSLNELFTKGIEIPRIRDRFCNSENNIQNVYKCELDDEQFKLNFSKCTTSFLDCLS